MKVTEGRVPMKWKNVFAPFFGGVLFSVGCSPSCPRAGCDALATAVADTRHSAVAGVIASETDTVENGCQECSFGSARLAFWKTASTITDSSAARTVVVTSLPLAFIQVDGRYEQPLDPGSYLVCRQSDCASIEVVAGRTTTVHVKLLFGPVQFVVFDAGSNAARTAPTLEVGSY